jgi:hypothetical protein
MFHKKLCLYHGTNHQVDEENKTLYLDHRMSKSLGSNLKKYMETPIMIPPNWQMEFHVHTYASLLAVGVMLA